MTRKQKVFIQLNNINETQSNIKKYLKNHIVCEHCGKNKAIHVHHIIPRSIGGTNKDYNLKALCLECHMKYHSYGIDSCTLQKVGIDFAKKSYPLISYMDFLRYIDENDFTSINEIFDALEENIIGYISEEYIPKETVEYLKKKEVR